MNPLGVLLSKNICLEMNEAEARCPDRQNDNWVGKIDCSPTVWMIPGISFSPFDTVSVTSLKD